MTYPPRRTLTCQASFAQRLRRQACYSRTVLYGVGLPVLLMVLAASNWLGIESATRYIKVIVGFSLLIFVHELGHFIVARMCSVKCDVFSIGIGPRMLGWKKGVGLTFGKEPEPTIPDEKTLGEKEDEKHARKPLEGDTPQAQPTPVGDTDYRLSWLPLGGYVRMVGQDDMDPTKVSDDPRSFGNRPIWQRMCIVSAGVTMNVIFAFIIFAVIFQVGVNFPPAIVGRVAFDSPAEKAGLQTGDRIVAIDDKRAVPQHDPKVFLEFTDLMISAALSKKDQVHTYTYVRSGEMGEQTEKTVSITPREDKVAGFLALGVEPMPSLKFPDFTEPELAEAIKEHREYKDLRSGDRIIKAGPVGQEEAVADFPALYRVIQASNGQPLSLVLHNTNPKVADRSLVLTPELEPRRGVDMAKAPPTFVGLSPRVKVLGVSEGSEAAKKGFQEGDIITRIDTYKNPTVAQFFEIVAKNPNSKVAIDVLRKGTSLTLEPTLKSIKDDQGQDKGFLGLSPWFDFADPVIAGVKPNSAAAAGIVPGSRITALNGQTIASWQPILAVLQDPAAKEVALTLKDPSEQETTVTLPINPEDRRERSKLHYEMGVNLQTSLQEQKANGIWDATVMGLDHTKKFIIQTYMTLRGLVQRTVSPSQLHGIVGIAKIGHDIQAQGFMHLLFILAVVSVNLAVANFLPLPIVDGGLFLLLILEKLRGKPLPLKVQSAVQLVGICLLAGLFIFVTYNDVLLFFKK